MTESRNLFSTENDGLKKALNIVDDLEKSLLKTSKYEERLLKCRVCHVHTHSVNEWWESDAAKQETSSKIETEKKTVRNQADLTESWSTISIVCLQYQYEELTKRYESLLQAYDDQSKVLNTRNGMIDKLRQRVITTRAQVKQAHTALLTVGKKYLALKQQGWKKEKEYERSIEELRGCLRGILAAATRARMDLDSYVERTMVFETDAVISQLLSETRRCNRLYLENLRLKAQIEDLAPGCVEWNED